MTRQQLYIAADGGPHAGKEVLRATPRARGFHEPPPGFVFVKVDATERYGDRRRFVLDLVRECRLREA